MTSRPPRRKEQAQKFESWACCYTIHPPRFWVFFYIYRFHWVNLVLLLSFCKPLHYAHSSLKCKNILMNLILHKGIYSLCTYNYSTWQRTLTNTTRSPPHWRLLDTSICHLNVTKYNNLKTSLIHTEWKKKSVIFSGLWGDICLSDRCLHHKYAEHSVLLRE